MLQLEYGCLVTGVDQGSAALERERHAMTSDDDGVNAAVDIEGNPCTSAAIRGDYAAVGKELDGSKRGLARKH